MGRPRPSQARMLAQGWASKKWLSWGLNPDGQHVNGAHALHHQESSSGEGGGKHRFMFCKMDGVPAAGRQVADEGNGEGVRHPRKHPVSHLLGIFLPEGCGDPRPGQQPGVPPT